MRDLSLQLRLSFLAHAVGSHND